MKTLIIGNTVLLVARNVANIDYIKLNLEKMAKRKHRSKHSPIYKWFTTTFLKYLINHSKTFKNFTKNNLTTTSPDWLVKAIERGEKVISLGISSEDENKYNHILDYMIAHPNENYSRIGVEDMFQRVEDWDEELANKENIEINKDELEEVITLGKYTWVILKSDKALRQEGISMGHCVGGDSYCELVENEVIVIYSLRDTKTLSKSFVTVEYSIPDKYIEQIQGKGNTEPVKYYEQIKHLLLFLDKKKMLKITKPFILSFIRYGVISNEKLKLVELDTKTPKNFKVSDKKVLKRIIRSSPKDANLNYLDVSSITDFEGTFQFLSFNGDISEWDMKNAKSLKDMFAESTFNGDISKWNVYNVEDISGIFYLSQFNGDISKWNVSNVEDISYAFSKSKFNKSISKWNIFKVKEAVQAFSFSKFNKNLSKWKLNSECDTYNMFLRCPIKPEYLPKGFIPHSNV